MSDLSEHVDVLKIKTFEHNVRLAALDIKIRSLTKLLGLVEQRETGSSDSFYEALEEIEKEAADLVLKTYSDDYPGMASIAKDIFDEIFLKKS